MMNSDILNSLNRKLDRDYKMYRQPNALSLEHLKLIADHE